MAARGARKPSRWSRILRSILVVGAFAAVVAAAAIRWGDEDPLERLREAEHAYYLGPSFDGHALTHVGVIDDGWRVEVGYGECRRRGSRLNPYDEDRCDYPVFVQTTDESRAIEDSVRPYPSLFTDVCARTQVLGVPAALLADPLGGGLTIYTGRTSINVMAERSRLLPAARMLRTAEGDRRARLPEPVPGVRERVGGCKVDRSAFEPIENELEVLRRSDPLMPFLGLDYEGARLGRIRRD